MSRTLSGPGGVGSGTYMTQGTGPALGVAGTFALFIKKTVADVEAGGTFRYVMDNASGARSLLYKNPDGGLTWWVNGVSIFDDTVASKSIITGTGWQHCAFGWDSAVGEKVYRNGSVVVTTTNKSYSAAAASALTVASRNSRDSFYWAGAMAELAWWSVLLNANEIAALAAGAPPFLIRPGSLQRYYPLFGDSTEPDIRGTGFGLTMNGSPTIENHPAAASFAFIGSPDQAPEVAGGLISEPVGFIAAATTVYTPSYSLNYPESVPFIGAGTALYTPSGLSEHLDVPYVNSSAVVYVPGYTLHNDEAAPFVNNGSTCFTPTLSNAGIGTLIGQAGGIAL